MSHYELRKKYPTSNKKLFSYKIRINSLETKVINFVSLLFDRHNFMAYVSGIKPDINSKLAYMYFKIKQVLSDHKLILLFSDVSTYYKLANTGA